MPKATEDLSRGTVEQLFLAIRFALIEELEKDMKLPVILDDIFVNFDTKRLLQGMNALEKLSENHQILLFTCHTHIVERMKTDKVHHIQLDNIKSFI